MSNEEDCFAISALDNYVSRRRIIMFLVINVELQVQHYFIRCLIYARSISDVAALRLSDSHSLLFVGKFAVTRNIAAFLHDLDSTGVDFLAAHLPVFSLDPFLTRAINAESSYCTIQQNTSSPRNMYLHQPVFACRIVSWPCFNCTGNK